MAYMLAFEFQDAAKGRARSGSDSTAVPPPWDDLVAPTLLGNGGAYRRLLGEIDLWLRRYYARRLPAALVDDAVQETLLAVHSKLHTYDPGRPFGAWLSGIARYKWIDRLRALAREPAESLDDGRVEAPAVGDHGAAVTSAIVVGNLLGRLKSAQTEAIALVKLRGFSVEEASRMTGQSASLVKVNIHRGLAKLSAIVEGVDPQPAPQKRPAHGCARQAAGKPH